MIDRVRVVVALLLALAVMHTRDAYADQASSAKLKDPTQLTEQAPAAFRARFETSQGVFIIEVHRDWAPLGADRFYNLVKNGFYDDVRFFRVLKGSWRNSD